MSKKSSHYLVWALLNQYGASTRIAGALPHRERPSGLAKRLAEQGVGRLDQNETDVHATDLVIRTS